MINFLLSIFCAPFLFSAEQGEKPLVVVPSIDLQKYCGTWYEIARLPNKFQTICISNVTATYKLLDDGDIEVTNRCMKASGEMKEVVGKARLQDENGPNTKLEVRFAPAFLSFLPFVWGNYWIIDLAADYSYAVIGEPDREYLWILSRSPQMDEKTYQQVLVRITEQGYDISKLQKTLQEK